jgi:RNA-binding protein YhbY
MTSLSQRQLKRKFTELNPFAWIAKKKQKHPLKSATNSTIDETKLNKLEFLLRFYS